MILMTSYKSPTLLEHVGLLPEHSFMLKSYGWEMSSQLCGGVGGQCDFSVSPWSKSFFFPFLGDLGVCGDRDLDLDLDQGLTISRRKAQYNIQ